MFSWFFSLSAAAVYFGWFLNLRLQYAHTKPAKIENASFSLFERFVRTKLAFFTFKRLSFSKALSVGESENSGLKF